VTGDDAGGDASPEPAPRRIGAWLAALLAPHARPLLGSGAADVGAYVILTMKERPSVDMIAGILLFSGLTREEHARLAEVSVVERFEAGSTIFREGDPSSDLYVMIEGRVALSMRMPGRPDKSLLTLRGGELLGWTALLGRARVATAVAILDTVLLRLPHSDLLLLCEADHHVGYAIMRQAFEEMSDRLQATRLQLLDMFAKPGG
jgi:CRP/FNR family cyclic AMP-dependent transcriptional regulator